MSLQSINEAVKKVLDSLPEGVKALPEDIKKNIHTIVLSIFDKLDIVTREEFEAQQKVLQATRAKLDKLEKELEQLSEK